MSRCIDLAFAALESLGYQIVMVGVKALNFARSARALEGGPRRLFLIRLRSTLGANRHASRGAQRASSTATLQKRIG